MEKIKAHWRSLSQKLKLFEIKKVFLYKEGGKSRVNFALISQVLMAFMGPLVILYLYSDGTDSSYLGQSPTSFSSSPQVRKIQAKEEPTQTAYVSLKPSTQKTSNPTNHQDNTKRAPIKLQAKQVIIREGGISGSGFLIGSNIIGELSTPIDTRDPSQMIRVVLPFGAKSKDGNSELPPGTLFMGQVNYPGRGEKVFINFQQAILPDGKPIRVAAQALDPKDYSVGLLGEVQNLAEERTLAVMGLSVASAMGSVLTEKEALGQSYSVTEKSSMKNALLSGASKAAEVEINRMQSNTETEEDYLLVDYGTVVILNLTQGLLY